MAHPEHTIPFRADIQGLRAAAVALVVLAHANVPGFAGGFVGVDVFFVLSGYLITGLLVRERLATGKIRYSRFLARRLRRLLPAMLAMLAVVLVLAVGLLSAYEIRMQAGSFVFAATWTSNFFFALSEFNYFDALQAKDLFLHTWSLGVEEQFYILWPWLLSPALLFLRAGNKAEHYLNPLLYLLVAVFFGSLALCQHWSEFAPLLSFFMMPARGWQFAMGAAVFVLTYDSPQAREASKQRETAMSLNLLSSAAGMLLIVGSGMMLSAKVTYPGLYALLPSAGAALVIAAGREGQSSVVNRVLESPLFVWVGDRSYSLYLWHWPVLLLGDAFGLTRNPSGVVGLIVTSVILSDFSYRLIERPFWKGRYSNAAPATTVLASIAVVAITVSSAHGLKAGFYGEPELTAVQSDYNPRRDVPQIYDAGYGCDTYYESAELVPCIEGGNEATYSAVLLSDSIGAQWQPLLADIYAAPDWKLTVLTKSACAIVDEPYYYAPVGGIYDVCADWREAAIAYIEKIRPDIVFIGSDSHYEFTATQWREGVARILDVLSGAATRVIVIPGTPGLSFNGPSCMESPYRFSFRLIDSRRECEEGLADTTSNDVSTYLEESASRFDNVDVLNLGDLVCPEQRCAAQSGNGLVVFRDRAHLTTSFVKAQTAEVWQRLQNLQVGPEFKKTTTTVASDK